VLSYGIALLFTIPCLCVGLYALHSNGVAHSTAFSAILSTTRNPSLDEALEGHSLGVFPLNGDIGNHRLKFGSVDAGNGYQRVAFGREGEVRQLRKGGLYI
jgi:hypothetical protein